MKPLPKSLVFSEDVKRGLDRLVDVVCRVVERQPTRKTKREKICRQPVGKSA